jgi:hypothetical protein
VGVAHRLDAGDPQPGDRERERRVEFAGRVNARRDRAIEQRGGST